MHGIGVQHKIARTGHLAQHNDQVVADSQKFGHKADCARGCRTDNAVCDWELCECGEGGCNFEFLDFF